MNEWQKVATGKEVVNDRFWVFLDWLSSLAEKEGSKKALLSGFGHRIALTGSFPLNRNAGVSLFSGG